MWDGSLRVEKQLPRIAMHWHRYKGTIWWIYHRYVPNEVPGYRIRVGLAGLAGCTYPPLHGASFSAQFTGLRNGRICRYQSFADSFTLPVTNVSLPFISGLRVRKHLLGEL